MIHKILDFIKELKNRIQNNPIIEKGKPVKYRVFRCIQCRTLVNRKMIKQGKHLGHKITNIIGKRTIWEMIQLLTSKTEK